MLLTMMKGKIHRATVTQAELNYIGSITIDEALLEAADILENERVQVVNLNNGSRFETYAIKGERNSGVICINGPAARIAAVGDKVIIISYAMMDKNEAESLSLAKEKIREIFGYKIEPKLNEKSGDYIFGNGHKYFSFPEKFEITIRWEDIEQIIQEIYSYINLLSLYIDNTKEGE